MKDLNADAGEISSSAYVRLKTGVRVLEIPEKPPEGAKIYIGTARGGVLFPGSRLRGLLAHLDGTRVLGEFLAHDIFTWKEIFSSLSELLQANLLIVSKEKISNRAMATSESQRTTDLRLTPEANLASWSSAMPHDGRELVRARTTFSILIFGSGRLAISLFAILQASGFSQTKIISGERSIMPASHKREKSAHIRVNDICGLNVTLADVGTTREETITKIVQSAQLLPGAPALFPAIPNLIISTESAQPDYIQRWMSEGVAHLQISHLTESFIEVGPLVIPGISPCLRCVGLQKFGAHKIQGLVELYDVLERAPELSSASTATIAGIVAASVIQFADTGRSPLTEKSIRFDLLDICNPEHIYWQPHIFCGCLEVI